MSLSETDRSQMIRLHLEKAQQFLTEADEYAVMQRYSTAANRYYYACFHAIHALFVKEGLFFHLRTPKKSSTFVVVKMKQCR